MGLNPASARSSSGALNEFPNVCAPQCPGLHIGVMLARPSEGCGEDEMRGQNSRGRQRRVVLVICVAALPPTTSNVSVALNLPIRLSLQAGLPPRAVTNIRRVTADTVRRTGRGKGKDDRHVHHSPPACPARSRPPALSASLFAGSYPRSALPCGAARSILWGLRTGSLPRGQWTPVAPGARRLGRVCQPPRSRCLTRNGRGLAAGDCLCPPGQWRGEPAEQTQDCPRHADLSPSSMHPFVQQYKLCGC